MNVSVLFQQPGGTFAPAVTYSSGGYGPQSVAIGDLDGDGRSDLAVANYGFGSVRGNVSVLLQQPGGTFAPAVTYSSGGTQPYSVAIGDLDGDGCPDLAVANYGVDHTVGVLLAQSGGTFAPAVTYSSGGIWASSTAIGDLNRDGLPDLAVANGGNNVSVLWGEPGGTFARPTTYDSGGGHACSVAIGDLNDDGLADLAVANSTTNDVAVLLGQSGGGFAAATAYYSGGSSPRSVAIGDLNGDGHPDLAVANSGSGNVGVLFGHPDGTFGASQGALRLRRHEPWFGRAWGFQRRRIPGLGRGQLQ